jgi:D-alanyl-D-alanine carboxypeptidase
MQKNTFVFLIVAFFCFQQAFTQNFNKNKLDSLFDGLSTYNKSMGTVLIVRNDTLVYNRSIGYGIFSDAKKELLSEKSRYRIGSITKMFTAIMIFQLIEEHKLTLSTPLSVYFPQIPNSTKITIANLLSHRSGLYNYTNDWDSWRFTPQTHEQMLKIIASKKVDFEPDTKTAYSNSNYLLLGYIVEKICRRTYAEAVKQRITAKMGLADTYYGGKVNVGNKEVYSYQWLQETWKQQPETDMSVADGAGAMVSTARDLSKFIAALFSHKLINDTSLQQMVTIKDGEGMGIEQLPFYDKLVYGHSGMIDLFQSWLLYFPKEKISVVYTSNGYEGFGINDILKGILHIYFDKAYAIPNFKVIQLKPVELDKYTGVYTCKQPDMKLTLTKEGNTLIGQATGQSSFTLEAIEQNKFQFSKAGIIMEFFPDKNEMVLHQGGGSFTFTRQK